MKSPGKWWSVPDFSVCCLALVLASAGAAFAQPLAEQTVDIDGETLRFSVRAIPADARPADAAEPLEPTSALNTAKLLNRHLSNGKIEDAALLSNAPRRRFEVLREYEQAIGKDAFRQVYAAYFNQENRLVAEIVMDGHSLLVWHLKSKDRYVGQYYVRVEERVLMDDIPSQTRIRLARVLEAIRAGKVPVPFG